MCSSSSTHPFSHLSLLFLPFWSPDLLSATLSRKSHLAALEQLILSSLAAPKSSPLPTVFFLHLLSSVATREWLIIRVTRKIIKNKMKTPPSDGGLQICPSSVKFTSARNVNTKVKRKCEKWVKWSELYRITKKDPQKYISKTQACSQGSKILRGR